MVCDVRPWVLCFGRGFLLVGHLEKILACAFLVVVCTFCWFESRPVCQCGNIYRIPGDNTAGAMHRRVVFSRASVAEFYFYFMSHFDALRVGGVHFD